MTSRKSISDKIDYFIQDAIDFCSVVDEEKNQKTIEFLQNVYKVLLKLIQSSSELPNIKASENSDNEVCKRRIIIYDSLSDKLSKYNLYSEIFDPFEDKKSVEGTLSDDITDIYCELKSGLDNWEKSDSLIRNDIAWDWKFGFESHWGEHITGAIRALYFLLFRKINGEDGLPIGLREMNAIQ